MATKQTKNQTRTQGNEMKTIKIVKRQTKNSGIVYDVYEGKKLKTAAMGKKLILKHFGIVV